MRPLRILMIRGEYGDHGPGTQSLTLGRELSRRGHTVEYVSSGGILVEEIAREFVHHTIHELARERRDPLSVMSAVFAVRGLLSGRKIDLVHSQNAAAGAISWYAQFLLGHRVPIVSHVRGVEIRPRWWWRNLVYRVYSAHFLAVSHYTKRCLESYGVPSDRITVTYNGVDLTRFAEGTPRETVRQELGVGDDELLVGTVGAMTVDKGHDDLVRAAALLRADYPNARYLLVGTGMRQRAHEALARDLGVADICYFVGFRRDIPQIMRALDVFALPSKRGEMFPNVLVEANSVGVPWIASRLAGIPELSDDGRNGLLSEPGDARSLARGLAFLLSDVGLRTRVGEHGRCNVLEHYTIKAVVDRIEDIYERVIPSL